MMLNKYYIKQFNITNSSFQEFIKTYFEDITKVDYIVGYLFIVENGKDILNIYLFKKRSVNFAFTPISLATFKNDWELFFVTKKLLFKNPPIEMWLDTKNNWCKKLANHISKKFGITYDEALSEVYNGIMICYNNVTVYMGNLNYIKHTIINNLLKDIRYEKKRLTLNNPMVISLDQSFELDSEDDAIKLNEIIAAPEDCSEESSSYRETLKQCKKLLSGKFTEREIDMILTIDQSLLPRPLYKRLWNWRNEYFIDKNIGDLYKQ